MLRWPIPLPGIIVVSAMVARISFMKAGGLLALA